MSKEKQILLLYAEGYSQRTIAIRLKASRNTVASMIAAAKRAGLQASQIAGMEEKALTSLLFPEKELEPVILDRIKHDAYKINIVPVDPSNYRSMREVYGLDPATSE